METFPTLDQFKTDQRFQSLDFDGKAQALSLYFAAAQEQMTNAGATPDDWRSLAQAKQNTFAELRPPELAPVGESPITEPNVGAFENFGNSFVRTMYSMKENIYYQLMKNDPASARIYRENAARLYPIVDSLSADLGSAAANILPSAIALAAAPFTGGGSVATLGAALLQGSIFAASAAGGARGAIKDYEMATGEDVGSFRTATVMAGHAIFELAFEAVSFHGIARAARAWVPGVSNLVAGKVGQAVANGSREMVQNELAGGLKAWLKANGRSVRQLGIIATTEGVEEAATQISQNMTDNLYRPVELGEGAFDAFKMGALGGGMLGPFAISVGNTVNRKLTDSLIAQDRRAIEMAQKSRPGMAINYDPNDRKGGVNAEWMGAVTEGAGMTGTGVVPYRDDSPTAEREFTSGNFVFVNVAHPEFVKNPSGMMTYVLDHGRWHALFNQVPGTRDFLAELIKSSPKFSSFNARFAAARADQLNRLGAPAEDAAQSTEFMVDEVLADFGAQNERSPEFQKAMLENAKLKNVGFFFLRRLKKNIRALERFRGKTDEMLANTSLPLEQARQARAVAAAVGDQAALQQALVQTYTLALSEGEGANVFNLLRQRDEEEAQQLFDNVSLARPLEDVSERNTMTMAAPPGTDPSIRASYVYRAATDDVAGVASTPLTRRDFRVGDVVRTSDGKTLRIASGRAVDVDTGESVPLARSLDVVGILPAGSVEAETLSETGIQRLFAKHSALLQAFDGKPVSEADLTGKGIPRAEARFLLKQLDARGYMAKAQKGRAKTLAAVPTGEAPAAAPAAPANDIRFSTPEGGQRPLPKGYDEVENTGGRAIYQVISDKELAAKVKAIRDKAVDLKDFYENVIPKIENSTSYDEVELTSSLRAVMTHELMILLDSRKNKRGSQLGKSGFDNWRQVDQAAARNFAELSARKHALGFELRSLQVAVMMMSGSERLEYELDRVLKEVFKAKFAKGGRALNISSPAFQREIRGAYTVARAAAAGPLIQHIERTADAMHNALAAGVLTPDEAVTQLAEAARLILTSKKPAAVPQVAAPEPGFIPLPPELEAKVKQIATAIKGLNKQEKAGKIKPKAADSARRVLRRAALMVELEAVKGLKKAPRASVITDPMGVPLSEAPAGAAPTGTKKPSKDGGVPSPTKGGVQSGPGVPVTDPNVVLDPMGVPLSEAPPVEKRSIDLYNAYTGETSKLYFSTPEQDAWRAEMDEIAADPIGYAVRLTSAAEGRALAQRLATMNVDAELLENMLTRFADDGGGRIDALVARIMATTGNLTGETSLDSLPNTARQQVAQLIRETPELEPLRKAPAPPTLEAAQATVIAPDEYRNELNEAFEAAAKASGFASLFEFLTQHPEATAVVGQTFDELPARVKVSRMANDVMRDNLLTIKGLVKDLVDGHDYAVPRPLLDEIMERSAANGFPIDPALANDVARVIEDYLRKRIDDQVALDTDVEAQKLRKVTGRARAYASSLIKASEGQISEGQSARELLMWMLEQKGNFVQQVLDRVAAYRSGRELIEKEDPLTALAEALGVEATTPAELEQAIIANGIPQPMWSAAVEEFAEANAINLREVIYDASGVKRQNLINQFVRMFRDADKADAMKGINAALQERADTLRRQWLQAVENPKERGEPVGFYDKLARLSAIGGLSGSGVLAAVADFVGIKNFSEDQLRELKELVDREADIMQLIRNPDAVEVVRANIAIQQFLTEATIKTWKRGEFIVEQLRKSFYGSALSGITTILGTNPIGSAARGVSVMMDELLRRLGAPGTGVFGAPLKAIKRLAGDPNYNKDAPRMTTRDIMELMSIAARAMATNSRAEMGTIWTTGAAPMREVREKFNELNLSETDFAPFVEFPGLAKYVGLTDKIAKYVGRAMKAGDAVFFSMMNEFGSAVELWDEIRTTNPDMSVEETWSRIRTQMGLAEDGRVQQRFVDEARRQLAEIGVDDPDTNRLHIRALELAREQRDPEVQRAGRRLGKETTYTQDLQVHSKLGELRSFLNKMKSGRNVTSLATTFIIPFTNIATGMIDAMLDYHPMTSWYGLRKSLAKTQDAELTEEQRKEWQAIYETRAARTLSGLALTLGLMLLLVVNGDDDPSDDFFEITGRGPSDPRKKSQWLEAGHRPFTMRIGKFSTGYRVLPIMPILYAFGAMNDAKYEGENVNFGVTLGLSVGSAVTDQSYATAIADFIDLLKTYRANDAGWDKKMMDFVSNPIATSLTPAAGLLRSGMSILDPAVEAPITDTTATKLMSSILSRVPLAGDIFLPGRVNALGSDVMGDTAIEKMPILPPAHISQLRSDNALDVEIFEYAIKHKTAIPVPAQGRAAILPGEQYLTMMERRKLADLEGKAMTTAQYMDFLRKRGDLIREYYFDNKEAMSGLSDEDADTALRKLVEISGIEAKRAAVGLPLRRPGTEAPRVRLRKTIREAVKTPDEPVIP